MKRPAHLRRHVQNLPEIHQVAARLAWVLPIAAAYGFASNLTYAVVGAGLRRWLAQGDRLLWFNRAMAAVLAATALWMATV